METWKKNLYSIWFAQFLTMVGMNLVIPFLPFYIRELGITNEQAVTRWSGIVFAGPFLLSFFMTPFWGNLGDRYGRKLMVVRAILGLALSQFLIAFAPNVQFLLFFRIIQGSISGFIPSALALVSSTTPKEKCGYAIGFLQSSTAAGTVIGPLLGGLLADVLAYRTIFLVTASLCLIAGVIIIKVVKEGPLHKSENSEFRIIDNYKVVFSTINLRLGVLLIFVSQFALMLIQPIFALYIEKFNINPNYISTFTGIAFSILGIFMLISSPLWGRIIDKKGYKIYLPTAVMGAAIACILLGLAKGAYEIILFRAIQGLFMGGVVPSIYSYISRNSNPRRQAGIMSIASSLFMLANLFGPFVGGLIASLIGIQNTFFVSGIVLTITSLYLHNHLNEPTPSDKVL